LQTTPSPILNIAAAAQNALISWTVPSTNFLLQESSNPAAGNWTNVITAPVFNPTNLQLQVPIPSPAGARFFRLKR